MKKLLIILFSLAALELNAQDLPHFKQVVKELSNSRYQGVFKLVTGFIENSDL